MAKNIDIPDGWEVKKLGEVAEIYRGASPRPISNYLTNSDLGIPWIKIGDINPNDKYIIATKEKITQDGAKYSKIIHSGYFVLSNSMSIGRPYISKITGCIHDGWLSISNYEKNITTDYLYYALNSQYIKKSFTNHASLGTVTNLNSDIVKNTMILLPPLDEQKKIADILSLWDKAIQQTKELIAYKEKQKKGLMQNLLTGKKRLHGFNEKWKTTKLGEVAEFISGYSFSSDDFTNSGLALIKISNINNEKIEIDSNTSYLPLNYENKYSKFIIRYNDILIAMSGATTGKMGVYKLKDTALLNQRVGIIRAKENNNQIFLIYILKIYSNKILEMAYGGAQPNISFNDIYKIKLKIPTSIDEQKAIADILSKADEEINLLNKQLDLYTEQKKGLMQNLLTGKVRV